MGALDYVRIAALVILLPVFIAFVVDAWKVSRGQFLLTLLVPFYVVYFAFVKAQRPWFIRALLVVCAALLFIPG